MVRTLIKYKYKLITVIKVTTTFRVTLGPSYEKVRTEEFELIQYHGKKGHFLVDCVTNVVLINLNLLNSDGLTFDKKVLNTIGNKKSFYYEGPLDGDVIFSVSAKQAGSFCSNFN